MVLCPVGLCYQSIVVELSCLKLQFTPGLNPLDLVKSRFKLFSWITFGLDWQH